MKKVISNEIKEGNICEVYDFNSRFIYIERIFQIEKGFFKKRMVKMVRWRSDTGDIDTFFKRNDWGDIEYKKLKKFIINPLSTP